MIHRGRRTSEGIAAKQSKYSPCVQPTGVTIIARHMTSRQNPQQAPPKAAPTTRAVVDQFNQAFNRHDADALAALLTDDTVFENTSPPPDGLRIEGKAAVIQFWREWFTRNSDSLFEAEDIIVSGDRAVVLWIYRKMRNGQPWHVRGVDVFTVRDGKVSAKLAYVKG
jgi:ketosteroid isomerase-like protein